MSRLNNWFSYCKSNAKFLSLCWSCTFRRLVLRVFNSDFVFATVLNDFCSQTTSECMPSTSRTNCIQTTPTLWCQVESLWPSLTWHGRSWNSFTPRIITPAMPGRPTHTHTHARSLNDSWNCYTLSGSWLCSLDSSHTEICLWSNICSRLRRKLCPSLNASTQTRRCLLSRAGADP